eukprot:scaffold4573_cov175-Prasinococcus_capsulatus_cf.AAC.1
MDAATKNGCEERRVRACTRGSLHGRQPKNSSSDSGRRNAQPGGMGQSGEEVVRPALVQLARAT